MGGADRRHGGRRGRAVGTFVLAHLLSVGLLVAMSSGQISTPTWLDIDTLFTMAVLDLLLPVIGQIRWQKVQTSSWHGTAESRPNRLECRLRGELRARCVLGDHGRRSRRWGAWSDVLSWLASPGSWSTGMDDQVPRRVRLPRLKARLGTGSSPLLRLEAIGPTLRRAEGEWCGPGPHSQDSWVTEQGSPARPIRQLWEAPVFTERQCWARRARPIGRGSGDRWRHGELFQSRLTPSFEQVRRGWVGCPVRGGAYEAGPTGFGLYRAAERGGDPL